MSAPFFPTNCWRKHLKGFETSKRCRKLRELVASALNRAGDTTTLAATCTKAKPCRSGLCPVCIRRLRAQLLDFACCEQGLHRLKWQYVTIRVEGWTKAPGDSAPFGKLRDYKLIEALITQLKRIGVLISAEN